MGKTWDAELEIFIRNPPERKYIDVEIPISDEEYEKMNEAISNGTELSELPFYSDLLDRAEKELDPSWLDDYGNPDFEPVREDFDDEEEYQEALEEYNNWEFSDFDIMDVVLNDPGGDGRFKKAFVGRKVEEGCPTEIELSDYEHYPQKEALVGLTLSDDGVIEDVYIDSYALGGAESESYTEFNDCEPDYWWIEKKLESYLDLYWAE